MESNDRWWFGCFNMFNQKLPWQVWRQQKPKCCVFVPSWIDSNKPIRVWNASRLVAIICKEDIIAFLGMDMPLYPILNQRWCVFCMICDFESISLETVFLSFFHGKKTAKKTPLAGLGQQFPLVQYMRTPLSSAGNYGKLASLCNSTAMVLPKKCSCRFFGRILLWTHLIKSPKFQPETCQPTQQKIRASSDSDKVFIRKTS